MFDVNADSYDRFMGRYSRALAPVFARFADVGAGQRVLDVGCGSGVLTSVLAEITGASNVAAIDPQPQFVAATAAAIPGVHAQVGRAEELPWPDATFDTTFAQLVVAFMADAVAGVTEMARVTRDGGTVAYAMWDVDALRVSALFWQAARNVGVTEPPAHLRNRTEPELRELAQRAGLHDVRVGSLGVASRYADFDDLWATYGLGVGPIGAFYAAMDAPTRDNVREAMRALVRATDGPFELTASAWAIAGTVDRARD